MINGEVQGRKKFAYKTFWRNRSKNEKRLIIASVVSAFVLLLLALIYLFSVDGPKECSSSTCARTSMELLLKYIDIKVDPCEDFYQFTCGNFLQTTNLDDQESRSVENIIEKEIQTQIKNMLADPIKTQDPVAFNLAKKFYRACMNETAIEAEGLKRMKQIFKQIGGWPTLNENNWRKDLFNWKEAVYKLRELGINFESFFILSVEKDKAQPDRYILNLKSPYRPFQINTKIKKLYLEYMVDLAVLLGAQRKTAQKEQSEVLDFLLQLAEISEDAAVNETGLYNPLSLSVLEHDFRDVHWQEYINRILSPISQITIDDVVSVADPYYLRNVLKYLKTTENRTISNFMCWTVLQDLINYAPAKMLSRAHQYVESANEKKIKISRSNTCLATAENRFSTVISAAYIQKYLDENTRRSAMTMIRNIKYQFKENLYKLDWLDRKTKDIASEKLLSSVEDIPHFNDFIERNKLYNEVEILEDKLLTSALNLDYVTTNIQYGKLRQPVRENFFETPGSVTGLNIVYSPKENALRIPLGRFREIFYQKHRPEYMNYGALGTVIAHEMYHIITQAEYRGLQGELRSWWSSHSLLNYEVKLQCLSNHYGKFVMKMIEQHLNASNTRDEDMADLAGMKVAYDTYISWVQENGVEPRLSGLNYSPHQLFWISSAIHHCAKYSTQSLQRYIANYQQSPGQFRVNGALQNLDEFAMDFGCPVGTNMNPAHKCRIW